MEQGLTYTDLAAVVQSVQSISYQKIAGSVSTLPTYVLKCP